MKKFIPLLILPVFSFTVVAQEENTPAAPDERQASKPNFEQLDRNQDGAIDIDEAKADKELAEVFVTIAPQGKLEQKQYVEWRAEQANKHH